VSSKLASHAGVVYAGAMDPKGHMRALDAATGKILWSFESGGSVASGPAIADGMVFWGSGYEHLNSATVHQSVSNDMFYAFALSPDAANHSLRIPSAITEHAAQRGSGCAGDLSRKSSVPRRDLPESA
jgi:hypothetical protein